MCPWNVSPTEIARGVLVEMEHTRSSKIAREIACDHLWEDPHYYAKLAQIHLDGVGSAPMARARFRAPYMASGTCGSGCWLEKQPNGQVICVCGDTLFKGAFGLSEGTKKLAAVGFLMAAAIGGAVAGSAIKKHTVRRRY